MFCHRRRKTEVGRKLEAGSWNKVNGDQVWENRIKVEKLRCLPVSGGLRSLDPVPGHLLRSEKVKVIVKP